MNNSSSLSFPWPTIYLLTWLSRPLISYPYPGQVALGVCGCVSFTCSVLMVPGRPIISSPQPGQADSEGCVKCLLIINIYLGNFKPIVSLLFSFFFGFFMDYGYYFLLGWIVCKYVLKFLRLALQFVKKCCKEAFELEGMLFSSFCFCCSCFWGHIVWKKKLSLNYYVYYYA